MGCYETHLAAIAQAAIVICGFHEDGGRVTNLSDLRIITEGEDTVSFVGADSGETLGVATIIRSGEMWELVHAEDTANPQR